MSVIPMSQQAALAPAGLVPASMGEAMKLAEMMAGAKLVPQALQKSPADCLMVIQQAVRWQMDPFAVAQECSVIQGKLMHSGKLVAAVVNARGNLTERLSFGYAGDGDNRTVTVRGRFHGEREAREVAVRLGDAKTSNKVWQTQADQQLMYHGTRVWARRHAPELMLGVYSPEEFDEPVANAQQSPPRDVTPQRQAIAAPTLRPAQAEPPVNPETGEVSPHAIAIPETADGGKDWIRFGGAFIAAMKASKTIEESNAWQMENLQALDDCEKGAPKAYGSICKAIKATQERLAAPAEPEIVGPDDLSDPARLLSGG